MTKQTDLLLADLIATHSADHPLLVQKFHHMMEDSLSFLRLLPESAVAGDLCLTMTDSDEPNLVGYVRLGDLTVQGSIYNENSDGAHSLVVLGDLSARNVVVGGQVIYVGGNATVVEVFGGDYNHGDCVIAGNLNAPVIVTHDYKLLVLGSVKGIHAEDDAGALVSLKDGKASYGYGDVTVQLLICDEALDDESAETQFMFYGAVDALKAGKSLLRPGVDLSPQSIAALKLKLAPLLAGIAQYEDEEYEDALASFANARRVGNASARLDFHEAAALYRKSSESEEAEVARMRAGFERAIAAEYQTNESRLYLAYSYSENAPINLARARALAHEVIADFYSDDDEKGQANDVLGACLLHEKKHIESVAYFQAAVALEPDRFNLQSNLGRALYLADDYAGAIAPLQAALEIDEDVESILLFRLAFCCFQTERWADAIKYADHYCEVDDDEDATKVTVLSMKGLAQTELGQTKKASALYSDVRRIEKDLGIDNHFAGRLKKKVMGA